MCITCTCDKDILKNIQTFYIPGICTCICKIEYVQIKECGALIYDDLI